MKPWVGIAFLWTIGLAACTIFVVSTWDGRVHSEEYYANAIMFIALCIASIVFITWLIVKKSRNNAGQRS